METLKEYSSKNFNYSIDETYCANSVNIIDDSIISEEKIDINKVYPMQIPSKEILQKIVDTSNPKAPTKDKGGKGLYVFNDMIKKESELLNVGKGPLQPIYVCFMSNDGKDPKSTKFYGLAGFSTKYFTKRNKAIANEIDADMLKKMKNYLHIIIWQTDPQYAKAGLAKRYLEILQKAAKELKSKAISIKAVDDKVTEIYKSLGFKEVDGLKDYLVLQLKNDLDKNIVND